MLMCLSCHNKASDLKFNYCSGSRVKQQGEGGTEPKHQGQVIKLTAGTCYYFDVYFSLIIVICSDDATKFDLYLAYLQTQIIVN